MKKILKGKDLCLSYVKHYVQMEKVKDVSVSPNYYMVG
jgi:hypothetical protein